MAALCRSLSSKLVPIGHNRHSNLRVLSCYWSRGLILSLRAFASSDVGSTAINDDDDDDASLPSQRNKPRIHLSRRQIRRLWRDLGDVEATSDVTFPAPVPDATVNGRISFDPETFPLELFEPSESSHEHESSVEGGIKQALAKVEKLLPSEQRAALEEEIVQCLKRATREKEPHKLVEKAHRLLEEWHEHAERDAAYPTPSWYAHESILRGWKRIGLETPDFHASQRADQVLRLLLNLIDEERAKVQGRIDVMFMWVMRLWLHSMQFLWKESRSTTSQRRMTETLLDCAIRASDCLLDQERFSFALNNESLCSQPQRSAYASVLNAFNVASMAVRTASIGKRRLTVDDTLSNLMETAARRSEQVLIQMQKRAQMSLTEFSAPDAYAFRAVVSSWANLRSAEGIEKTSEILRHIETAPHTQDLTETAYIRILLHTYALISPLYEYDPENSQTPVLKALSVLSRLDPELLSRYHESGCPTLLILNDDNLDKDPPDETRDDVCYGMVIQTLAQVDAGKATTALDVTPATLAEMVLDRMEELHSAGLLDKEPNSHCYGNVIRALSLWAGRSVDTASIVPRIERILELLERHVARGVNVSASTSQITKWYNLAISIVSQKSFSGSPSRADKILKRMEEHFLSTISTDNRTIICPDEASYCLILSALEQTSETSGELQTARHAINVLRRMNAMHDQQLKEDTKHRSDPHCRPSKVAYNMVLRTCTAVSGGELDKREAMSIANEVFEDLQTYTSANSTSYALMIKAHACLAPAGTERSDAIAAILQKCRGEGRLDASVKKAAQEASGEDTVIASLETQ